MDNSISCPHYDYYKGQQYWYNARPITLVRGEGRDGAKPVQDAGDLGDKGELS